MSILSLSKCVDYFYLDSKSEQSGGTGLRWRRNVASQEGMHLAGQPVLRSHTVPEGTIPFERVRVKLKEIRAMTPAKASREMKRLQKLASFEPVVKVKPAEPQDEQVVESESEPDAEQDPDDVDLLMQEAAKRFIISRDGDVCRRYASGRYEAGRPVLSDGCVIRGYFVTVENIRLLLAGARPQNLPPKMNDHEAAVKIQELSADANVIRRRGEMGGIYPVMPATAFDEMEAHIHNLELDVAELKAQMALLLTRIP